MEPIATPIIQRQLALNAHIITFYHDQVAKGRASIKAAKESADKESFDALVSQYSKNKLFYKACIRKYSGQQKAFKAEIKARKKPKAPVVVH